MRFIKWTCIAVCLSLVVLGAASAAWVESGTSGSTGAWINGSSNAGSDWKIKIRRIIGDPQKLASTVHSLASYTVVAWGTETQPGIVGADSVALTADTYVQWEWDNPSTLPSPVVSAFTGTERVTHTRQGKAKVNHTATETYHGDYSIQATSLSWSCKGVDGSGSAVTGSGTVSNLLSASDFAHAGGVGNGSFDVMPHSGQSAPSDFLWVISCSPSGTITQARIDMGSKATGAYSANTAQMNPRSEIVATQPGGVGGSVNGASYISSAKILLDRDPQP